MVAKKARMQKIHLGEGEGGNHNVVQKWLSAARMRRRIYKMSPFASYTLSKEERENMLLFFSPRLSLFFLLTSFYPHFPSARPSLPSPDVEEEEVHKLRIKNFILSHSPRHKPSYPPSSYMSSYPLVVLSQSYMGEE